MIHVVAAALLDGTGRVLLTQRPPGRDFAGCWEFPGGKRETGESAVQALHRELGEELGIEPLQVEPLIRIPWAYAHKHILLDVFRVPRFRGEPSPREGQGLRWQPIAGLDRREMPPADHPAVTALQLPDVYLITPEPKDVAEFLARLDAALARGLRLVQIRAKAAPDEVLVPLLRAARARVHACGGRLLVNARIDLALALDLDGVHLTSQQLAALDARPLPSDRWVAASCHDTSELAAAVRLGADFAVLGPVLPTASHPGTPTMGWQNLSHIVKKTPIPVYALGGLGLSNLSKALELGAQGVAGIEGFWSPKNTKGCG